ncbi:hypothetical protein EFK50_13590 [Nocardioides marmoriginsengisoli]|uniref:MaoC-like domain-containing protein n=1 Tax=Nocardioides marmoriginsengisoli TaxID=661483 RepID=A0A3N0CH50_9ACTN|nr:MaoC family dehydratase N-terminal domain-containing protein [Nocardioides marmoriginsengisoli]RNL62775.1 hypothetical protein EFK50_13590 [Nocardioides marmoriginsengisoli]
MTEVTPLITLSRTDIVRYAGAGGDFNPVHHDDPYARELGFSSVFAMGMFTAGLAAAKLVDEHLDAGPGSPAAGYLIDFSARFASPSVPGDALVLEAYDNSADHREFRVLAGEDVRLSGTFKVGAPYSALAGDEPAAAPHDPRLKAIADTVLSDVVLPVERGKIIEFARSVGATDPSYFDVDFARSRGFADLPMPPTFSQVVAHWNGGDAAALPRELGLDLARVVHGTQTYKYGRTPTAGETLTGRRQVIDVKTKTSRSGGEMTFVTVQTTFTDEHGTTVLVEQMSMIEQPAPQA